MVSRSIRYSIYHISLAYVIGIISSTIIPLLFEKYILLSSSIIFLFWGVTYVLKKQAYINFQQKNRCYYIGVISLFFLFGGFHFSKNKEFKKLDTEKAIEGQIEITHELKPNSSFFRYYALFYPKGASEGIKILINSNKKNPKLHIGDVGIDILRPQLIYPAQSPFDFDYKAYLNNKSIYYNAYTSKKYTHLQIRKSPYWFINKIRNYFLNIFSKPEYTYENQTFIAGLLFGQKQYINSEILTNFRKAGVAHVLAISGLHILILCGFIQKVINKLTRKAWVHLIIISVTLVFFSLLTNMGNSVIRASLMFIIYLISKVLKLEINKWAVLTTSAFLILWFLPNNLFDIGFQMSYLAVASILIIHPVFEKYTKRIKNKILYYLISLLTISLSIQLGIASSSIYYFHEFPVHFLLSNFITIQVITLVLVLCFLQLITHFIWLDLSRLLATICNDLLNLLHNFIYQINQLPVFSLENIYITKIECCLYTITVFLFAFFIRKKHVKFLFILIGFWAVYSSYLILDFYLQPKNLLYVMQNKKGVDFIFNTPKNIHYFTTQPTLEKSELYEKKFRKPLDQKSLIQSVLINKNVSVLCIDSLGIYPKDKPFDLVILMNDPKINIERIIKNNQPKKVIIHSKNSWYKKQFWMNYLKENKIPFSDLKKDGYLKHIVKE